MFIFVKAFYSRKFKYVIMNQRIQELIEKLNLTSSKFADEIGVPRSSISHIVSGRNKPSLDFVTKILEKYPEVNINWLLFGRGECFSGDIESSQTDISSSDTPKEIKKEASEQGLFSHDNHDNKEETANEVVEQAVNKELKDEEPEKYNAVNTSKTVKKEENNRTVKTSSENDDIEKLIVFYNDKSFEVFNKR